jgi:hypothetical protein
MAFISLLLYLPWEGKCHVPCSESWSSRAPDDTGAITQRNLGWACAMTRGSVAGVRFVRMRAHFEKQERMLFSCRGSA